MVETQVQSEIKPSLRARIRADRRALGDDERERLATAVADVLLEQPMIRTASVVAAYASLPWEPGTGPLRAALRAAGVSVLLPIRRPDDDLDWAVDTGTTSLSLTGPALPEPVSTPVGPDGIAAAEVIVAPALAVDTDGFRLGQGGGSYDRALRRVSPSAVVLALVFDDEVFDAAVEPLPREPHDVRVDGVLTPTHCMLFGA